MPALLFIAFLLFLPIPSNAAHEPYAHRYEDKTLLPFDEYFDMFQGGNAEKYEDAGKFLPDFARRVLAQFVLHAELLGAANELPLPPVPDTPGVTLIEVSPGIIKYYDTSRINRAMNGTLFDENGEMIHYKPNSLDIKGALEALPPDDTIPANQITPQQVRFPFHRRHPLWMKHFGPLE